MIVTARCLNAVLECSVLWLLSSPETLGKTHVLWMRWSHHPNAHQPWGIIWATATAAHRSLQAQATSQPGHLGVMSRGISGPGHPPVSWNRERTRLPCPSASPTYPLVGLSSRS